MFFLLHNANFSLMRSKFSEFFQDFLFWNWIEKRTKSFTNLLIIKISIFDRTMLDFFVLKFISSFRNFCIRLANQIILSSSSSLTGQFLFTYIYIYIRTWYKNSHREATQYQVALSLPLKHSSRLWKLNRIINVLYFYIQLFKIHFKKSKAVMFVKKINILSLFFYYPLYIFRSIN